MRTPAPPAEAAQCAAASDLSARTLTTERVVREKCEPKQKTQIRSDLRGSQSVKGDAVVSPVVDTQVEQAWPVTEGSDLGASAPGADAIGPNIKGRSAVRRRGKRDASAPGADAASSAGVSVRDRDAASSVCRADTATGVDRRDPECLDAHGYWSPVSEDGAREPSDASVGVDFTSSLGLVTEGADALSAKSKKEHFDEQRWDSLKSSPLYEVLREYKAVLPDDIPAELPQDKGV
ncbi:unnamed protein product [Phytophthora fragariaefolia]|uniref:Unnamed protein product n=1 Tax=Phytophthora fragariaefolia TaxID=1490495 RepID=A0A9W7D220_9STRA|nr:unnamed protein product [Phytophthora fragariaefolia]